MEEFATRLLPYLGGAAGLALLGYGGLAYHNYIFRRELRRIRFALEHLARHAGAPRRRR